MAEGEVGFQSASIFDKAGLEKAGKSDEQKSASANPLCPQCGSKRLYRDGLRYLAEGLSVQRWLCRDCAYRFSEKPPQEKQEWLINTGSALESRRRICAKEAKNLTLATEIKTVAGLECITDPAIKGKILQFAFYCKKEGLEEITCETFATAIRSISRYAKSIDDPESVKEALAKMTVSPNTKFLYTCAYTRYLDFLGKTWKSPRYRKEEKLPEFLPTELELDQLIAGSTKRLGTFLQLMKETGMRLGECLRLTWTCINTDTRIITLTHAEKHSSPRSFNVSTTLIGMLNNLPKINDKVFGKMGKNSANISLINQRKQIAHRLNNPRIGKIHFHLIRHWYATMQYHKRPDIFYVSKLLGHKHVATTQIYINMEKMAFGECSDDYTVKVAKTIDEACKLLEVGFEFVTDMDGQKLFRKRK